MRTFFLRFNALTFFTTLSFAVPSLAVAQADDDADSKAYNSYQLTLPKYKKYLAVLVEVANSPQKEVMNPLEDMGELSIDEQVTRLNKVPEFRNAISRQGLTTREFVVLQGALLGAALTHLVMKQAKISTDSAIALTEGNRANLEFYRRNEAEINRLNKEAEAKSPALKAEKEGQQE